jgi:hypothetical protein
LLRPVEGGIEVDLRALEYDHAVAVRTMREKKLPEGYAQCLETGLWPNMDVMPAAERGKAGVPIDAGTLLWPDRVPAAAE